MDCFHYTNRAGYNGIRSQRDWRFEARQPKSRLRPVGAYFTSLAPTARNLRSLYAKIRVPRPKREFVFWFTGTTGLVQLNHGRGRDRYTYFSRNDYFVERDRQKVADMVENVMRCFE